MTPAKPPSDMTGACALESALGCLVVVARAHGLTLTAEQLVRDNLLAGPTLGLEALLQCARAAGLRCTALPLAWPALLRLGAAFPAIALVNGAAVVIEGAEETAGGPGLRLRDPLTGDTAVSDRVAWSGWGDHVAVVLLRPSHDERPVERPFGFGLIGAFMMRDRGLVIEMTVSALLISVLALTPIVFWSELGTAVLPSRAINTYVFLCVAAGLLILFEGAFTALRRHVLVKLTARIDQALSAYMFDRLLALPIEVFETTPVGTITHKIGQMAKVRAFLTGQLFGAVLDGGVLIIFLPVMAVVSPTLTVIVMGFVGLIAAWLLFMLPVYRRRSEAVEDAEAERGAFLSQTIQGMRTVRSMALDARQLDRWDRLTARTARLRLREADLRNLIQSVVTPLERLSLTGTIAIGVAVALVDRSAIAVGALLTFIMLTQRVAAPLLQLSQLVQQFDEARNAVGHVAELLNQPSEEGRSGHGVRTPLVGHVAFAGLRFRYRGAVTPALKDVSFEIAPGMSFGIMGRSGSGKTTITRLLQRLHADYQGSIRLDGVDVRAYDVDHLRASLGVVLQENFLFSGTIRDNIAAAKSDATAEEVIAAARLAGAEEFIDKLPRGYDTVIYEGSPNLSGGQRQRIAIARALITDPKILILDEATSALDAESEAIVNANLKRIAAGRTTIVISHRLASLVACDAILVLDAGEVHDIGRHPDLLERCDIYAGLWARQNQHAAPAPLLDTKSVPRLTRGACG